MDVKKLIQAAEYCAIEAHETCEDCPMWDDCPADERDPVEIAIRLLAVRDHAKAEGRAEGRAEVIAQVREWAEQEKAETYGPLRQQSIRFSKLIAKLDELAGEERHG